jgi:hypothetical protein
MEGQQYVVELGTCEAWLGLVVVLQGCLVWDVRLPRRGVAEAASLLATAATSLPRKTT